MAMLYHITLKANFDSIMSKGLIPKAGINTSPEDMGCDWSYDAYIKYIDRFGDYISYSEYKKQKKSDWDILKKNKITKGVYFGLHINICLQMASAMKKLRNAELVLLAVDSAKLKTELLIDDPDTSDSKCYKNKIPAHLINVIAIGTNNELTNKLILQKNLNITKKTTQKKDINKIIIDISKKQYKKNLTIKK